MIAIPIVLLILPADHFDHGEVMCPSKRFLDFECLGCGLTRAVQHLIHFEFQTAWDYNKLVVIVFPLIVLYWFHLILLLATGKDILVKWKYKKKIEE